ncbi:TMCO4 family protein [Vibrio sp. Of7-15]|uniref:DUF726 domain-containing protein n=1 Tax=Vibrio sp. Of7-15 TaxID=2724879 RepID=UPI001EF3C863|nr:DUF726 domain-containing protein [Vibrio sp. Of7-15]MCG7500005.1 TMCO4 family protein [Vibrio sp. Of7-15]
MFSKLKESISGLELSDVTKKIKRLAQEEEFIPRDTASISLEKIREGIKPSIMVINGFMSEGGSDVEDWIDVVDALYPNHEVIHVQWNAGNVKKLILDEGIAPNTEGGNLGKLALLTRASTPVGMASIAGGLVADKVSGHWKKAFNETRHVGLELAIAIEDNEALHGSILMGHSLGGRVIRHTLHNLAPNLVSVSYLLAAAVSANEEQWKDIFDKHDDLRVINCMSKKDYVLKSAYKVGTLFDHDPAGLAPLCDDLYGNVLNLDVSEFTSGHTRYKHKVLGKCIADELKLLPKDKRGQLALGSI